MGNVCMCVFCGCVNHSQTCQIESFLRIARNQRKHSSALAPAITDMTIQGAPLYVNDRYWFCRCRNAIRYRAAMFNKSAKKNCHGPQEWIADKTRPTSTGKRKKVKIHKHRLYVVLIHGWIVVTIAFKSRIKNQKKTAPPTTKQQITAVRQMGLA